MRVRNSSLMILSAVVVLGSAAFIGCSAPANNPETPAASSAAAPRQDVGGQEEFGPYDVVANWPQPVSVAKLLF